MVLIQVSNLVFYFLVSANGLSEGNSHELSETLDYERYICGLNIYTEMKVICSI